VKKVLVLSILIPVALFAAGQQSQQTQPNRGMSSMMMSCPMSLQGTSVAVANTPTGLALSITTDKPENVAEVRRRAEQMAAMHSTDHPSQAMMQGQMMPGTVKYEAIDKGARLTLTPKDPSRLEEFRKQVRAHVEQMQKGECTMMMDMMQGMMHGMMGGAQTPKP
jgi:TusA-related sulfurtransferase